MIDELRAKRALQQLDKALQDPTVRKDLDLLMTTEGKDRQAQHRERMKAEGYKQATVWLSDKSQRKIEKLTKKGNSISEAVNELINS